MERAAAKCILQELRLAPWTQTADFLSAAAGKTTLALDTKATGVGRRGHIFYYERAGQRGVPDEETAAAAEVRICRL